MTEGSLPDRSGFLATRVDGLATALHASGVSEDAAARLLASASAAVLQAVTLDLLFERQDPVASQPPTAEPETPAVKPDVPLAA